MNREMSELEKKIDKFLQSNNPEKNTVQIVVNYLEQVGGEENFVLHQIRLFTKEITAILKWKSKYVFKSCLRNKNMLLNLELIG